MKHKTKWGNWEFIKENLTLEHATEGYYIDLERCNNSAQTLDWIFQVQGKTWADAETVGTMIEALDYISDPQGYICTMEERGREPFVDVAAVIQKATRRH